MSLFASRQILTLMLPENGPNAAMAEKLTQLSTLLHSDLLLILRGHKLTKAQENSRWFKDISSNGLYISCLTLSISAYHNGWLNELNIWGSL